MPQCWHACHLIAMLLRAASIGSNPLTVELQVLRNGQCVERIGSLRPRHGGRTWTVYPNLTHRPRHPGLHQKMHGCADAYRGSE